MTDRDLDEDLKCKAQQLVDIASRREDPSMSKLSALGIREQAKADRDPEEHPDRTPALPAENDR